MESRNVEQAAEASTSGRELGPVHRWIVDHDERWSFLLAYVGLAVGLSMAVGLFWLVVVVGCHFAFEVVKKRYHGCRGVFRTAAWSLWDMKFDVALVIWAVAMATYLEATVGIAGLSSAGRAGGMLGGRLPALTRLVRLVPLPLKDVALGVRMAMVRRIDHAEQSKKVAAHGDLDEARAARLSHVALPWQERWTGKDHFGIWFAVLNALGIAVAPLIVEETPRELLGIVLGLLHPLGAY